MDDVYCDLMTWIESDSWSNFRRIIVDGLCDYNNSKKHSDYDFEKIRQAILNEHREDIIKDLNQDMVKEIEDLKKHIDFLNSLNDNR